MSDLGDETVRERLEVAIYLANAALIAATEAMAPPFVLDHLLDALRGLNECLPAGEPPS